MFDALQEELKELRAQGLYRSCRRVEAIEGARIRIDGRWLIHLASNNYLGLSQHPRVVAAAQEAIQRYGAGTGSARLISGTFSIHEELEERLARFKQAQSALVFPTGYMANLGIIQALVGPGDLVIGDHLNHASLVDASRLSRAAFRVYPHRDLDRLESALKHRAGRYRRVLIVTEGVFSMDGDLAPLPGIAELTRRYNAWLLIDDAHATGVFGAQGRGTLEHFGIPPEGQSPFEGILQMGTLSKALGSQGGYLAGPRVVVDYLRNKARSFIYTTALAPASAAAALEALNLIEEEPVLRAGLWNNVREWVSALDEMGCDLISRASPIVPIRIGSSEEAVALAQRLFEAGIYAPAIRPPTVPAGSARIRTSLTALHTQADSKSAIFSFKNSLESEKIGLFPVKAYDDFH
ncbi:MAG: 8-amino-7-oxononanoate synthase [Candidatus Omnitrophica bacterium]|nr:8-amino-7-oxononanoate synthase [Candidatus Omnitrophota bacterium]